VSGSVIDESCQKVAATHHAGDHGDEELVNTEGEMDTMRDRTKERKKERKKGGPKIAEDWMDSI